MQLAQFLQAIVGEGSPFGGLDALNLAQHVLDDVSGLLEVDRQLDDFRPAPSFFLGQVFAVHARQIEFHPAVQRIDIVIHAADFLSGLGPLVEQHALQARQHGFDQIADAQGFAHRVGQRQARSIERCGVEVARLRDADIRFAFR